ncbi:MAG: sortase, partial [Bradyrhizobium sp.]|nr:sortase [Bradyrhizobium sp.]
PAGRLIGSSASLSGSPSGRRGVLSTATRLVRRDGKTFRYRADAFSIVRFDASGIDPTTDNPELVLSTCWPFDALTQGPERYVLHATLIAAR